MESIEPNTPPFVMVKVPPAKSDKVQAPDPAFSANPRIAVSICEKDIVSASRITGTTKPRSLATATPMS